MGEGNRQLVKNKNKNKGQYTDVIYQLLAYNTVCYYVYAIIIRHTRLYF